MQTKGFILTIATALVLICIFYLSFSIVGNHYENKAIAAAMKANGGVKDEGSQKYKDAYRVPGESQGLICIPDLYMHEVFRLGRV